MSQKTLWLVGLVLLLALIGGLFLWYPRQTQEAVPDNSLGEEEALAPNQFIQQEPSDTPSNLVVPQEEHTLHTTPSPAHSPVVADGAQKVTVTIDESGFTPSTITIAAGTAVTFVNNGQAAHWPASDNHPTHDVLPEFDAKRGLSTGETYIHTFTKVGTWTLHDHLMPRLTGTVIVQ